MKRGEPFRTNNHPFTRFLFVRDLNDRPDEEEGFGPMAAPGGRRIERCSPRSGPFGRFHRLPTAEGTGWDI
jgi:hypothetical protein